MIYSGLPLLLRLVGQLLLQKKSREDLIHPLVLEECNVVKTTTASHFWLDLREDMLLHSFQVSFVNLPPHYYARARTHARTHTA